MVKLFGKNQQKLIRQNSLVGLALLASTGLMLSIGASVHAEASETATVNYSVSVRSSLSLTLPTDPIQLNLNPSSKTFDSSTFNVTAGTNHETGYTLTLSTPNDITDIPRVAASQDDNINAVISTLPAKTGGYTDNEFTVNKWGYKITANTSKPSLVSQNWVPFESGITLMESSAAGGDTATISLGAKINYDQPYGTYSTTLNFAMVANPTCATTISGTMQDFNPATLCSDVTTGTLTDARDTKSYTVAKLADGNWWMTQNLDLAGNTQLYSDTSDVADGYPSSGSSYYYKLPASSTSGFNSDTGQFVYNTTNRSDPSYCSSSPGCYSYYSWLAATAGSGSSASPDDGGRAAYSICPKGWKLPSATTDGVGRDTNNGYTGGDFYKMITKYMGAGVTTLNQGYYDNTNPNPFNTNAGPGTTPNFLLAGYCSNGSFYFGGSGGYYWSSSSGSSTSAYNLYFGSSYVTSAGSYYRRYGFPVRCLLSGSSS